MAITLNGDWPQAIPLVMRWLESDARLAALSVYSAPPEHCHEHVPFAVVSAAAGGTFATYTKYQPVDIDVYAASRQELFGLAQVVEARLFRLQGNGNARGYVDSAQIQPFFELDSGMPGIVRAVATVTLAMRPQ